MPRPLQRGDPNDLGEEDGGQYEPGIDEPGRDREDQPAWEPDAPEESPSVQPVGYAPEPPSCVDPMGVDPKGSAGLHPLQTRTKRSDHERLAMRDACALEAIAYGDVQGIRILPKCQEGLALQIRTCRR